MLSSNLSKLSVLQYLGKYWLKSELSPCISRIRKLAVRKFNHTKCRLAVIILEYFIFINTNIYF